MTAKQDPVRKWIAKGIERFLHVPQWPRYDEARLLPDGQSTHFAFQSECSRSVDGGGSQRLPGFKPHPDAPQRCREVHVARRR